MAPRAAVNDDEEDWGTNPSDDESFDALLAEMEAEWGVMPGFAEGGAVEEEDPYVAAEGFDEVQGGAGDDDFSLSTEQVMQFAAPEGGRSQAAPTSGSDDFSLSTEQVMQFAPPEEPEEMSGAKAFMVRAARATPGALGAIGGGALAGSIVPGWGTLGGAAVGLASVLTGAVAGGMAADLAAEEGLKLFGVQKDVRSLTEQAEKEHPILSVAGDVAPFAATMGVGSGLSLARRALMGGIGGGLEAGSEVIQGKELDPLKIAANAAASGVFSGPPIGPGRTLTDLGERAGNAINRAVGRPETPSSFRTLGMEEETAAPVTRRAAAPAQASTPGPMTAAGTSEAMPPPVFGKRNPGTSMGGEAQAPSVFGRRQPPEEPSISGVNQPAGSATKYPKGAKPAEAVGEAAPEPAPAPAPHVVGSGVDDPTIRAALANIHKRAGVGAEVAPSKMVLPDAAAPRPVDVAPEPPAARVLETPGEQGVRADQPAPAPVYQHPDFPQVAVNHQFSVPRGVGIAENGKTLYLDQSIPPEIKVRGLDNAERTLNPALPLAARQMAEEANFAALLRLRRERISPDATPEQRNVLQTLKRAPADVLRASAREGAGIPAESAWLKNNGIDEASYRAVMDPILEKAGPAEGRVGPPPDLKVPSSKPMADPATRAAAAKTAPPTVTKQGAPTPVKPPEAPVTAAVTKPTAPPTLTKEGAPAPGKQPVLDATTVEGARAQLEALGKDFPDRIGFVEEALRRLKTPEQATKLLASIKKIRENEKRVRTETGAKEASHQDARDANRAMEAARSAFEKFPPNHAPDDGKALQERLRAAVAHAREVAPSYTRQIMEPKTGKMKEGPTIDPIRRTPKGTDEPALLWMKHAIPIAEAEKVPSARAAKAFMAKEELARAGTGDAFREGQRGIGTGGGKALELPADDMTMVSGKPRMFPSPSESQGAASPVRKGALAPEEKARVEAEATAAAGTPAAPKAPVKVEVKGKGRVPDAKARMAQWLRDNKKVDAKKHTYNDGMEPILERSRLQREAVERLKTKGREGQLGEAFRGDPVEFQYARKAQTSTPVASGTLNDLIPLIAKGVEGRTGLWRNAVLQRIQKMAGDVPVHVLDDAEMLRITGGEVDGFYDPGSHQIVVGSTTTQNGAYVIAHEAIHAITSRQLYLHEGWAKRIGTVMNEALEGRPELELRYGMKDPHEFLAEALTNKQFQDELDAIPLSKKLQTDLGLGGWVKTLWGAIVENARAMLGLPRQAFTALDAAMRATDTLSTMPVSERAQQWLRDASIASPSLQAQTKQQKKAFKEYAASLKKEFDEMDGRVVTHKIELQKIGEYAAKNFKLTDAQHEAIYRANEWRNVKNDDTHYNALSREEKRVADFAQEVRLANRSMYAAIKHIDEDLVPMHTSRLAKRMSNIGEIAGEGGLADPVTGAGRALNTTTGPLKEQEFFVAKDAAGNEKVISAGKDGFVEWDNFSQKYVEAKDADYKPGHSFEDDAGNTYTLRKALTEEIEANAHFSDAKPAEYHKHDVFSALRENALLYQVVENARLLEHLKGDPVFLGHATTDAKYAKRQGLVPVVDVPQFKGWFVPEQWSHVFEDFGRPGLGLPKALNDLSRHIIGLMFWNPVPHILNAGAHWFVGRGWDWIKPTAYRDLVKTGMQAVKSVLTQDATQAEIRAMGGGIPYGGVITKDFMNDLAKNFGLEVTRNPSKWNEIAKATGLSGANELQKAVYKWSARTLWAANDMMYTQRYLELKARGINDAKAKLEVEKDFPSYKLPTTVLGSRFLAKVLGDNAVVAFGRYHHGVYKAFANELHDLVKGTPEERFDAVGKFFALGLLAFAVKPAFDAMARVMTGNEKAEAHPRGPLAPIAHATKFVEGKADYGPGFGGAVTISPLLKFSIDSITNQDFAGRKSVERGDMSNPSEIIKRGGQLVEQTAAGLISPYSTIRSGWSHDKEGAPGVPQAIANAILDVKSPTRKGQMFLETIEKRNLQDQRQREKNPRGPIENMFNYVADTVR